MNSRPIKLPSLLNVGNRKAVVAISTQGNTHLYPSITSAAADIFPNQITENTRKQISNRCLQGGGELSGWYFETVGGNL